MKYKSVALTNHYLKYKRSCFETVCRNNQYFLHTNNLGKHFPAIAWNTFEINNCFHISR